MNEIVQFFVEVFLQFFVEVLANAIGRQLRAPTRQIFTAILYAIVAALLAWLSIVLVPEPFLTSKASRIAYLAVAPVIIGLGMAWIGRYMVKRERARGTLESFGFGWLFAFSFALTRFLLIP